MAVRLMVELYIIVDGRVMDCRAVDDRVVVVRVLDGRAVCDRFINGRVIDGRVVDVRVFYFSEQAIKKTSLVGIRWPLDN
jgi:hypothetical protein